MDAEKRFRVIVSLSIGAIAAAYARSTMLATGGPGPAADFTYHWLAARALLSGHSPYAVIHGGTHGFAGPYVYPVTSAIVALPFASWLGPVDSAAAFIGLSSALLAFAIGYQRLPVFLSTSFLWAANSGQLSPLIAAGTLLPALGWAAPIKPNLGIASLVYRPSKAALIGSALLIGCAFLIYPHWFQDWLETLSHRVGGIYFIPLTLIGGPLILLVGIRSRLPEARLLLALTILPQAFLFYDALLLWLIPRTWKESLLLSAFSWAALLLGNSIHSHQTTAEIYAPFIIALLYLPCVIMVVRRQN
jgi:hypothetical protein